MLKFAMCAWLSRLRSKGGQMLPQSGLSWRGARGVSGPGSLVRPVRLCPETCRPGPGVGPHGDSVQTWPGAQPKRMVSIGQGGYLGWCLLCGSGGRFGEEKGQATW